MCKMGLWLLALELVSTWHFKPAVTPPSNVGDASSSSSINAANDTRNEPATTPNMLEDFTAPSTETSAPKSMLAAFDVTPKPPPAPKSLLEDFGQSPADKAKSDREAKATEIMAKLKVKKEQAGKPRAEAEKKAPTNFKEPAASSILDSFGL
jgi:hypothetical protein